MSPSDRRSQASNDRVNSVAEKMEDRLGGGGVGNRGRVLSFSSPVGAALGKCPLQTWPCPPRRPPALRLLSCRHSLCFPLTGSYEHEGDLFIWGAFLSPAAPPLQPLFWHFPRVPRRSQAHKRIIHRQYKPGPRWRPARGPMDTTEASETREPGPSEDARSTAPIPFAVTGRPGLPVPVPRVRPCHLGSPVAWKGAGGSFPCGTRLPPQKEPLQGVRATSPNPRRPGEPAGLRLLRTGVVAEHATGLDAGDRCTYMGALGSQSGPGRGKERRPRNVFEADKRLLRRKFCGDYVLHALLPSGCWFQGCGLGAHPSGCVFLCTRVSTGNRGFGSRHRKEARMAAKPVAGTFWFSVRRKAMFIL